MEKGGDTVNPKGFKDMSRQLTETNDMQKDEVQIIDLFANTNQATSKKQFSLASLPFAEKLLRGKGGWILFSVLLIIQALVSGFFFQFGQALGNIVLSIFTLVVIRKVQFQHTYTTGNVLSNLSITIKAWIRNHEKLKTLLPTASQLINVSLITTLVIPFLFNWFSWGAPFFLLFSLSWYGFWMGVIFLFAQKKINEMISAIGLYVLVCFLVLLGTGFVGIGILYYILCTHFIIGLILFQFFYSLKIQSTKI